MSKNNLSHIFSPDGGATFKRTAFGFLLALVLIWQGGCSPTVKIETPEAPITINLNVKIDHQIRVKVDRELDDLINEKSDIF